MAADRSVLKTFSVSGLKIRMTTPIKRLIVLFDENISFDPYFGTYPNVANKTSGEPGFAANPGTRAIAGSIENMPISDKGQKLGNFSLTPRQVCL
ncbi:hypothetical protein [Sporolactobacillus pectinivorans]|uniref:hypothetical protein n=1 Tax=Sporolactobacillus pectinivorans TaxID=1591408 RepID=UPI00138FD68E|nr:hypothetical protein [Sporolactobacillus pectinivorans]